MIFCSFGSSTSFVEGEATETNENWDEAQLTEVAQKKHGEADKKRPNQTDIVSN